MLRHIATLLWNTRRAGVLLAAQIFLAFVALFAVISFAGYMLSGYVEPLGFRVANTYIVDVQAPDDLPQEAYPALYQRLETELESLHDVREASSAGFVTPFGQSHMGYGNNETGVFLFTQLFVADADLARVMGPRLLRGRWYTDEDTIGGRVPMVVNAKFVEDNFPGGDLVDTTFLMMGKETTVTGVVEHFKYRGEFEAEEPLAFFMTNPYDDPANFPYTSLLIHTAPDAPLTTEQDIFERVAEVTGSRNSVVSALEPIRERTSRSSWVPLVTLFLICAFLVANVALGLFGILINAIARRRGEIGLRKALGATGANVTAQLTSEVTLIAVVGLLLGAAVAAQVPILGLIELEARYFWWGGLAAAGLILLLVVACALIPSGQAARIHPAVALREE